MAEKKTNKTWEILSSELQPQTVDEIIELLLKQRAITIEEEKEAFLNPRLETITIDSVSIDAKEVKKTVERLRKAHEKKELVVVFGDYDVDGITGTAILWETLIALGFKAMPYIPHRVDEGYGLSKKGITNAQSQLPDIKLMITVDNGIVAHEAVEFARDEGIDVIITDHHLPDDEKKKPKALALVHTTKLCGAGVAWLLSKELQKAFGSVGQEDIDIHLELAALATVADLVPLTGSNRTIVYHGLKKLSQTKRHGLVELYARAAVNSEKIGVYEISHIIGPRLNAAGRLESAMDSLRLLCTRDRRRAFYLAERLDMTNQERQRLMHESVQHASLAIRRQEGKSRVLIIAEEMYEEGIIGLVAGRLVEEFHRPAIVISKGEKISKGSVRSVKGFNIIEFLRSRPELFINVGGHPMAAGFTIETERLSTFKQTLEELAETVVTDEILERKITIDLEIGFNNLSPELYKSLQALSPFGMGNHEPIFLSRRVLVREKRLLGKDGKHLRLILQGGDIGKVLEAVAFGMGDRASELQEEGYIDIVYTLDENEWNGQKRLQLKIRDFKPV